MKRFIKIVIFSVIAMLVSGPDLNYGYGLDGDRPEIVEQTEHLKYVSCFVFSNDGKYALSGSYNNDDRSKSMSLWNMSNGYVKKIITDHSRDINLVNFSPDGKYLLSVSYDKTMKLWDSATAEELRTFAGHTASIKSAVFSPDGKYILSVSYDNAVKLWDVNTGIVIKTFSDCSYAAISPDGKYLLLPNKNIIELLDFDTFEKIRIFTGDSDNIHYPKFSSDGKYILSVSYDKTIKIRDFSTGKEIKTFSSSDPRGMGLVEFSPDGKYIVSEAYDNILKLWDIADEKEIMTFPGHSIAVFSPDGKYVLSESNDKVKILNTSGTGIFSGSNDKTMTLWDVATGKEVKTFKSLPVPSNIGFSPDGKFIFFGSPYNTARILNIKTGEWVAFMSHKSKSDWLIFDSEGYWDSSLVGADLAAIVQGVDCYNINQFTIRNNRPDLILSKLPDPDQSLISVYKELYMERIKKLERLYDIKESDLSSDMHIPEAEIIKTDQEGDKFSIEIRFRDSKFDIAAYNIYVNGVPVYPGIGKRIKRTRDISLTEVIKLSQGENRIELSCINEKSAESYRPLAFADFKGEKKGSLYFIGIGVADYMDESINDLKYSEKDVLDLAGVFASMKKSYETMNIRTYIGKDVTVEKINAAGEFVKNAGVDDTVILFIAGHGIHDRDLSRTYYYLTQNTDMKNLKGTAVEFGVIENILSGTNSSKKLFLIDICGSGKLEDFSGRKTNNADNGEYGFIRTPEGAAVKHTDHPGYFVRNRYIYKDLFSKDGEIRILSARDGETSWEYDNLKNGVFAKAIIDVLMYSSIFTSKSWITINKFYYYINRMTNGYSDGKQNSVLERNNIYVKFELPMKIKDK